MMMSEDLHVEQAEMNYCPRCKFAFTLVMYGIKDHKVTRVAQVVSKHLGAVTLYCPCCGKDINSYEAEANADLEKYTKWKAWAAQQ